MGFIGSFLADELIKKRHAVTLFDNLDPQIHPTGQPPAYWNKEAAFVKGDVRDGAQLESLVTQGFDAIFHYAAAVGIGQSNYKIKHYVDVNQGGTANLLDILVRHKTPLRKLVLAASMASYGEGAYECTRHGEVRPPVRSDEQMAGGDWALHCPICRSEVRHIPTKEESALNCYSIYAINKMNQEQMVRTFGAAYGVPVVCLRYFNVYGPRQSLSNPYTGVSAIFISRIKGGHAPILYEDGQQTRDFVSVHDVVSANLLALESPAADFQTFNIGSGEPRTIASIGADLARLLGSHLEPVVSGKFRKGDVRHCYADITKARDALKFSPKVRFEDGMNELVEWSRDAESSDRFDQAERELSSRGIVRA